MTVTEIAAKHDVSRQTIHTYRRTGVFPPPVEGEGSTRLRFREDEVAAFFDANPKQPRKKRRYPPQQGETMDARQHLYAFAMQGKEHSPAISERASEKIDAYRAAVVAEVVGALLSKAQQLSTEAEEEMRRDLEDQAQVWHEAAGVAAKLKLGKAEASDG